MKSVADDLNELLQEEYEKATVGSDEWRKLLELKIHTKILGDMYDRGSTPEHIADMEKTILTKLHELLGS